MKATLQINLTVDEAFQIPHLGVPLEYLNIVSVYHFLPSFLNGVIIVISFLSSIAIYLFRSIFSRV